MIPPTILPRFQVATDTLRESGMNTAYDSIWGAGNAVPTQPPGPVEQVMLSDDKIFVVLAVVLIIWIGISIFLLRTDRKLDSLERSVDERIPDQEDDL
jgi:CcmD family protein